MVIRHLFTFAHNYRGLANVSAIDRRAAAVALIGSTSAIKKIFAWHVLFSSQAYPRLHIDSTDQASGKESRKTFSSNSSSGTAPARRTSAAAAAAAAPLPPTACDVKAMTVDRAEHQEAFRWWCCACAPASAEQRLDIVMLCSALCHNTHDSSSSERSFLDSELGGVKSRIGTIEQ